MKMKFIVIVGITRFFLSHLLLCCCLLVFKVNFSNYVLGDKTSVDIYARLKKTAGAGESPSLYFHRAGNGNQLLYQAPLDFHAALKNDNSFINNIDPSCWISSFLIIDQARSLLHKGAGIVEISSKEDNDVQFTKQENMLITKPGRTICSILEHHERRHLALEMTRCYMEEHKYMFHSLMFSNPLLHEEEQQQDGQTSFDISQCHDSFAIYSSPWTLQKCLQHMDDVGFLTYTQLVIMIDGICSRWSRSLWDYAVMESTMRVLEEQQNQSMQELSQMLINATEQLLQLQSLPNDDRDLLLMNEHERIRKIYEYAAKILFVAAQWKATVISVAQWYTLLNLSGSIPFISKIGVFCAFSTSFALIVITTLFRCLFGSKSRRIECAETAGQHSRDNTKYYEEQILENRRKYQENMQACLQQWIANQTINNNRSGGNEYYSTSRMDNDKVSGLEIKATDSSDWQPKKVARKRVQRCERDVTSEYNFGSTRIVKEGIASDETQRSTSKISIRKSKESDATVPMSAKKSDEASIVISPEPANNQHTTMIEELTFLDCLSSVDAFGEQLSFDMDEDEGSESPISISARPLKRRRNQDNGVMKTTDIICKRQKT